MKNDISHAELVSYAREWLLKPARRTALSNSVKNACSVVVTEMTSSALETADAIGWFSSGSVLVECKVSRGDYRNDRHKLSRVMPDYGVGNYRYYLTKKGLLAEEDLFDEWGLLEVGDHGKVKMIKTSKYFATNIVDERRILISLIRRLNIKEEDEHIAIKVYTVKSNKKPRATATIEEEE